MFTLRLSHSKNYPYDSYCEDFFGRICCDEDYHPHELLKVLKVKYAILS